MQKKESYSSGPYTFRTHTMKTMLLNNTLGRGWFGYLGLALVALCSTYWVVLRHRRRTAFTSPTPRVLWLHPRAPVEPRSRIALLGDDELLTALQGFYDVSLFEYYVSRAEVYLEFGAGGSTTLAAALAGKVYSVENNPPWCSKVTSLPLVKRATEAGVFSLACVDPAPVSGIGYPQNPNDNAKFAAYVTAPDSMGLPDSKADVIFVDGRFRVACAINAMRYMKESSILMIHDFWRRPNYSAVLQYYDVVDGSPSYAAMWRNLLGNTLADVLSSNHFTSQLSTADELPRLFQTFDRYSSLYETVEAHAEVFRAHDRRTGEIPIRNGAAMLKFNSGEDLYSTVVVLKLKHQYREAVKRGEVPVVDWQQYLADPQ